MLVHSGLRIAARMTTTHWLQVQAFLLPSLTILHPPKRWIIYRTFVMEYQRQQAQECVVYLPEVDLTV